ncbi:MAG: DnaJ C-terminal domain-containing protein, partial [bacterium]|nr:DnaJ C-terminal domain-containing protein [bacterium]
DFDFGNLGDIFGDILGFGNGQRKRSAKKGRDIEVDLEIPLESVLSNQEKEISLKKFIKCQRCQGLGAEPGSAVKECFSCRGTGEVQQIRQTFLGSFTSVGICPECNGEGRKPEKLCNVCQGEGRIKDIEKIKVFVPAGIDQNQVIKIEEAGEQGRRGKKAGDLYVRIGVKENPIFQRRGDDLFTVLTIPFSKAVLGGEADITDLSGRRIVLNIPAGAEPGKMLRLTGKGVPHFQGRGQGNLYIELNLKIPKKLSREQKELLEKLKEKDL